MENPIKMDDLGGTIIFGNTHMDAMGNMSPGPQFVSGPSNHPKKVV